MNTKIRKLIEILDGIAEEEAQVRGGYPDHITMIGDFLVIAGENGENGCSLEWYAASDAEQWYDAAVALKNEAGCEWWEAIEETRPERVKRMSN